MKPKPTEEWERIAYDKKSSSVSHFRYGYRKKTDGSEILVWEGIYNTYVVDEDGNIIYSPTPKQTEGREVKDGYMLDHKDVSITDDNRFIVEFHSGVYLEGADVVTKTAEGEFKVRDIVREWMDNPPVEQ